MRGRAGRVSAGRVGATGVVQGERARAPAEILGRVHRRWILVAWYIVRQYSIVFSDLLWSYLIFLISNSISVLEV